MMSKWKNLETIILCSILITYNISSSVNYKNLYIIHCLYLWKYDHTDFLLTFHRRPMLPVFVIGVNPIVPPVGNK